MGTYFRFREARAYLFISGLSVVLLGGLAAMPSCAVADETAEDYRTWSDDSGEHQVEAALVDYVQGKVRLSKKDGGEVTIAYRRLSDVDRQYVRDVISRRKEAETPTVSPFNPSTPSPSTVDDMAVERSVPREQKTKELYGIQWVDSLDRAVEATGLKPIVWFRVLGDLEGFM